MRPQVIGRNDPAGLNALAPARWDDLGGEYLLTNDSGCHARVNKKDIAALLDGRLDEKKPLFAELCSKGFINSWLDFDGLAAKWRTLNAHLYSGPRLHILVLTLRCNHECVYCQTRGREGDGGQADMDPRTARACVDFAFKAPDADLTLEFQGGEPLLNWEVLEKTVLYARKKEKASGKRLTIALVSNLSLMTEEKARFLRDHGVSICTSLDGTAAMHNGGRRYAKGDSHALTRKWLAYFRGLPAPQGGALSTGTLMTVTRDMLGRHKEIIDEYVRLGLKNIFIRPLAPLGRAKESWKEIGYGAGEFAEFYARSLRYIVELNRRSVPMAERTAVIMLEKILNFREPGFVDARCPCGAAIGQMAYSPSGDVYTCDEGRMLGVEGDHIFRMGNVFKDSYARVLASPAARGCVLASNLELQPACSRCAYRPYCGVCPVYNYSTQGSLWGNMATNGRCAVYKGVFRTLFALLKEPRSAEVLKKWVSHRK